MELVLTLLWSRERLEIDELDELQYEQEEEGDSVVSPLGQRNR
jgi:hypothetical protein